MIRVAKAPMRLITKRPMIVRRDHTRPKVSTPVAGVGLPVLQKTLLIVVDLTMGHYYGRSDVIVQLSTSCRCWG